MLNPIATAVREKEHKIDALALIPKRPWYETNTAYRTLVQYFKEAAPERKLVIGIEVMKSTGYAVEWRPGPVNAMMRPCEPMRMDATHEFSLNWDPNKKDYGEMLQRGEFCTCGRYQKRPSSSGHTMLPEKCSGNYHGWGEILRCVEEGNISAIRI